MLVKFTATATPPGKLAEAELHFTDGPLSGTKLIRFAVWERRGGNGKNVTFPAPARQGGRVATTRSPTRRHGR